MEDMYTSGRSLAFIADRLKRTPGAVRMQLSRQSVTRPAPEKASGSVERALGKGEEDLDLITLLQRVSGREDLGGHEGDPDVTEELARSYLQDPVAFINDFARFTLLPYQERMVRAVHEAAYVVLLCARQIGKSTVASYYALWHALTHPGSVVLLIGGAERQARLDMDMIRDLVMSHPILARCIKDLSQTFIRLKPPNNARIYVLPAGQEGATIRGYAADIVLVDEAALVSEAVFAAILPMIATKQNPKFILASTPRGRLGFLYDATRNPLWKVVRFTATDSSLITEDYLDRMRRILSEEAFRMEFGAEFIDEATSAFPFALLDAAEDPDLIMET